MLTRDQTERTIIRWIPAVLCISQLGMVEIEKRWRLHMLMNLVSAQNHLQHQITWVASAHSILLQALQPVASVGIGNLITVLIEKLVSAMASLRYPPSSTNTSKRTVFSFLACDFPTLSQILTYVWQMKNETFALWTWHRNQDFYNVAGDQIYIVRQPDRCPIKTEVIY